MKKRLLNSILSVSLISSSLPMSILSSCGQNHLVNEVYNQAIEEFVGSKTVEGITSIPRPSFKLDVIRWYIQNRFKDLGYEGFKEDSYGNMWLDIPASKGWEDVKPLILQGHMDMVWSVDPENPPEINHPTPVFDKKDGKEVIHTKDYQSSLGADDGQALALMIAIARNKSLKHGPPRYIFTANEEPGIIGACELGKMDGGQRVNVMDHNEGYDYLISMDNEALEEMTLETAAGYSYEISTYGFKTLSHSLDYKDLEITISGCHGGHSGLAMKNNYVNPAWELANFLSEKGQNTLLININSYIDVTNAVPTMATYTISCPNNEVDQLTTDLKAFVNELRQKHPAETNIEFNINNVIPASNYTLTSNDTNAIINCIKSLPYGAKETDDEGNLKASSNVCPVVLNIDQESEASKNSLFSVKVYSRANNDDDNNFYHDIANSVYDGYFNALSPESKQIGYTDKKHIADYPWYELKEGDVLLAKTTEELRNIGLEPKLIKVHAGSEMGCWSHYNPDLNQVALGPRLDDVHTPNETFYLETYKQMIKIALDIIEYMKTI